MDALDKALPGPSFAHRTRPSLVAVTEVLGQLMHTHDRVPVEGRGVEPDPSDHSGAGLVLLVGGVDGGVIVRLLHHLMGGQGVGHLGGGVEAGDVGDRPAEQRDAHRVGPLQLLGDLQAVRGLLQRLIVEIGELLGLAGDQVDDRVELAVTAVEQVGGVPGPASRGDSQRFQQGTGQAVRLFSGQAEAGLRTPCELLGELLGAGGLLFLGQVLVELDSRCPLPRLRTVTASTATAASRAGRRGRDRTAIGPRTRPGPRRIPRAWSLAAWMEAASAGPVRTRGSRTATSRFEGGAASDHPRGADELTRQGALRWSRHPRPS
ncbi:hypothetical protein GCM10022416_56410 [Actinomadura keratinilytica]|uniref:Uncharacterized protein n=1 Tax=Actinomadura keratinilytica TaxID=547461 RepID=A0ABP7ZFY0_9ACTN